MNFFVARSKKSDRYFKFEQYAEDGWGRHEDSVSVFAISQGEMPKFFTAYEVDRPIYIEFKDHTMAEVEFVEIEIKGFA